MGSLAASESQWRCSFDTNPFGYLIECEIVAEEDGRSGGIFLFDDGTGMVASSVMNGTGYYSGGDQTGVGGGIELSLNDAYCYDASFYDGISFTAYGSGKLGTHSINRTASLRRGRREA